MPFKCGIHPDPQSYFQPDIHYGCSTRDKEASTTRGAAWPGIRFVIRPSCFFYWGESHIVKPSDKMLGSKYARKCGRRIILILLLPIFPTLIKKSFSLWLCFKNIFYSFLFLKRANKILKYTVCLNLTWYTHYKQMDKTFFSPRMHNSNVVLSIYSNKTYFSTNN